jgi:hypothetical protein
LNKNNLNQITPNRNISNQNTWNRNTNWLLRFHHTPLIANQMCCLHIFRILYLPRCTYPCTYVNKQLFTNDPYDMANGSSFQQMMGLNYVSVRIIEYWKPLQIMRLKECIALHIYICLHTNSSTYMCKTPSFPNGKDSTQKC